ncbi:MAG TPA: hypothetical protein VFZ98_09225, partial [Vicinamibacterales bacterium]
GAMLGLAIFFWVYWDAFSLHHGFDTQELTGHLTQIDAAAWRQIWISPGAFVSYDSGRSFAMVFALGAAAWLPWLNVPARVRWCSLWFAGVTALMLAIPLRIGGVAPWRYVFEALPGFSAIRDPRRMQYPFELAIALALGVFTAQLPRSSVPRRIVVVFVLLVLSLKWNMERFDYERPLEVFRQFVDAPIAIDPSCRSFFVKAAQSHPYLSRSANPWPLYANDASFIAQKYAIPTLNGYSAWTPPDWHLFNPQDPDYLPGVVQWVSLNRLDHVCELDIERRTMSPFTARASGAFPR